MILIKIMFLYFIETAQTDDFPSTGTRRAAKLGMWNFLSLNQPEWLPSSSLGGATERSQFRKWRHIPNYQIQGLCKRNHDAIVVRR